MSVTIEISSCKDCLCAQRWNEYNSSAPYRCNHPLAPYPLNDQRIEVPDNGVAEWCPLRDLRVAAKKKERNNLIRRKGDLIHKNGLLQSNIERNNIKINTLYRENEKMEKERDRIQQEINNILCMLDQWMVGE